MGSAIDWESLIIAAQMLIEVDMDHRCGLVRSFMNCCSKTVFVGGAFWETSTRTDLKKKRKCLRCGTKTPIIKSGCSKSSCAGENPHAAKATRVLNFLTKQFQKMHEGKIALAYVREIAKNIESRSSGSGDKPHM